jgi:hypothetical protein
MRGTSHRAGNSLEATVFRWAAFAALMLAVILFLFEWLGWAR